MRSLRKTTLSMCAVMLTLLAGQTLVMARQKLDVLRLKNGDRVTGEIRELARGMLTLKTDSMGTVSIKWEDIVSVDSPQQFEVEGIEGRLHLGTLESDPNRGAMKISGPESEVELDHNTVVGLV